MKKHQIWFLCMTGIVFIGIWTIAIVQFTSEDPEVSKEANEELHQQVEDLVAVRDVEEPEDIEVEDKKQVNDRHNQLIPEGKIDLSQFDFSDISTPLGIPIDGILNKIGLQVSEQD
ncbi:hypothetical protein [Alkalihalobacillus pseudalcaliphilus]|uniref:hypothetical protein n=1 Tax=Alkalihalobacillus pseudalcaliphilus TaxID=79884 RepID=UPI00064DDB84|nr:hypothetical protein [Alkalihalobacillus pseudalcaliphilus]KMK76384.1 hypothetical protein AB990_14415 [Alkalihalobacillus pseudalcaliphilus]